MPEQNLQNILNPPQIGVGNISQNQQPRQDIASLRDVLGNYRQFVRERRPGSTREAREKYQNTISAGKAAITRARRLPESEVAPVVHDILNPEEKTGMATSFFNALDTGRNVLAKNIIVPMLGLKEELGYKDRVYGGDILGGLGMDEGILRSVLGFGLDIATDPLTYLSFGSIGAMKAIPIATKAGTKHLLPQGFKLFKGLMDEYKITKGLPLKGAELKTALGSKGAEEVSIQARKYATDMMTEQYNSGKLSEKLFGTSGIYAHVPLTNTFKQLMSYDIPKKLLKHIDEIPAIQEWTNTHGVYTQLQTYIAPFTTAIARSIGHPDIISKMLGKNSMAKDFWATEVAGAFGKIDIETKKLKQLIPEKDFNEISIKSAVEYEDLAVKYEAKYREKASSDFLFDKNVANNSLIKEAAQNIGMSAEDTVHIFRANVKMGEELRVLKEKAQSIIAKHDPDLFGKNVTDGFMEFYIPHKTTIKNMYEILPTGKESIFTHDERMLKTFGKYKELWEKHGFDGAIMNPLEAWTTVLTSMQQYVNHLEYFDEAIGRGYVKFIQKQKMFDAVDIAKTLFPRELKQFKQVTKLADPEAGETFLRYSGNTGIGGSTVEKVKDNPLKNTYGLTQESVKLSDKEIRKNASDLIRQKIAQKDKSLFEFSQKHFNDTGKPVGINLDEKDLRLIDERGKFGETIFDSTHSLQQNVLNGYAKRAEDWRKGIITKEIDVGNQKLTFQGRVADIQDFRDTIVKNIPSEFWQRASQAYNRATNFWKRWATLYGGSFIFANRNKVSDSMRLMYMSSLDAFNVPLNANAFTLMTNHNAYTHNRVNLKEFTFETDLGEIYTGESIIKYVKEGGLFSFRHDRLDMDRYFSEIAGLRKSRNIVKAYPRFMEKYNVGVENHTKLVSFLSLLKQGMSPEEAVKLTHEYIYNYKMLPKAVRKSLGFFPFGRWTYLNTKGMVKRFADHPMQQMTTMRGIEASQKSIPQVLSGLGISPTASPLAEDEQAALPEFYQKDVAIPLYRHATGVGILTSFDFPVSELNDINITSPGKFFKSMTQFLGSRLHPSIKSGIELATNHDFFFDAPLQGMYENRETGERKYEFRSVDKIYNAPGLKQIFGTQEMQSESGNIYYEADPTRRKLVEAIPYVQAILGRPVSEIGKLGSQAPGASLAHLLTGSKIYERDINAYKQRSASDTMNQINRRLDTIKRNLERRTGQ